MFCDVKKYVIIDIAAGLADARNEAGIKAYTEHTYLYEGHCQQLEQV